MLRACPICGFRRSQFVETAYLGCDYCYEAFADAVPGMLRSLHGSDRHAGRT